MNYDIKDTPNHIEIACMMAHLTSRELPDTRACSNIWLAREWEAQCTVVRNPTLVPTRGMLRAVRSFSQIKTALTIASGF